MAGFSGSDDLMDWVDNIAGAMNMGIGGYHAGFWNQAAQMRNCFGGYRNFRYAVGHSLGGGVAAVFASRYGGVQDVVTYAAPRSHSIFSSCTSGYRVYHDYDPVTHIPDFGLYKHGVSRVYRLDPQWNGGFLGFGQKYNGDRMIYYGSGCPNLPHGGLASATWEIARYSGIGIHNNYFPQWQ
jgi:pimeloyl-ACP methyl ester carboxylesterase